ncbi:MAG: response regulator [Bryobacterales bacterium]|nr:response regulator [Bryobacterales bacterium]
MSSASSRILLADDSPNAQRMGERILREEGFEVVTVTNGDTALIRIPDVDPDVVIADVYLPGQSGFDLCRHIKGRPELRHVQVVLTAGMLEPFNEEEATAAGCDGILKKPFEASVVVDLIKPLIDASQFARGLFGEQVEIRRAAVEEAVAAAVEKERAARPDIDPERVRAAITLALDAALPAMIEEITERVLVALGH